MAEIQNPPADPGHGWATVNVLVADPPADPGHGWGTVPIPVQNPPADPGQGWVQPRILVQNLAPNVGLTGAATTVTITGFGFDGVTSVKFGTRPATSVTVNPAGTVITCVTPTNAPIGVVDVTVTAALGESPNVTADNFRFYRPLTVTGISPNNGPTTGGTLVTLTGTGFSGADPATAVTFDGNPVVATVGDDTTIRFTTPASTAGQHPVVVTVPFPGNNPVTVQFTSVQSSTFPVVTGVSPSEGPLSAPTTVTVTGTGLAEATEVRFGTVPGVIESVAPNGTSITVTTPYAAYNPPSPFTAARSAITTLQLASTEHTRFTWDVTPTLDPSPDGVEWAHVFSFAGGGVGRVALQTIGPGVGEKAVMFAVNGADNGGIINVVGPPLSDGTVTSTYNGAANSDARTAVRSYPWEPDGTYRFTLWASVDDTDGTWWNATVTDLTTGLVRNIATIKVPLAWGGVGGNQFQTNRYSGALGGGDSCADVLHSITDWTNISAIPAGTTTAVTPTGYDNQVSTSGTACDSTFVDNTTNGFRHELGRPYPTGGGAVTAGIYDVIVVAGAAVSVANPSDKFTFYDDLTITSISPTSAKTTGNVVVNVYGTGFSAVNMATGLQIVTNGVPATVPITSLSETRITFVAPAHAAGTVIIRVVNPRPPLPNASTPFTYQSLPTVTSLDVGDGPGVNVRGPTTGGTVVTITGTGFTGATRVTFGGVTSPSFTVNSDTEIVAVSPQSAPKLAADVLVVNAAGTSTVANATDNDFRYYTATTVRSVTPDYGSTDGNTAVTVKGTGFTGVTEVRFDNTPVATFIVVNDSTITTSTPPHPLGDVLVGVEPPDINAPPEPPTNTTSPPNPVSVFTAVAGDAQAVLTWVPGSGGGAPVSYTVTRNTVNSLAGGTAVTYPASARTATITGLGNGQTYWFWITAVNANGTSTAKTASATPAGQSLTAPVRLAAIRASLTAEQEHWVTEDRLPAAWLDDAAAGTLTAQRWITNPLPARLSNPNADRMTGIPNGAGWARVDTAPRGEDMMTATLGSIPAGTVLDVEGDIVAELVMVETGVFDGGEYGRVTDPLNPTYNTLAPPPGGRGAGVADTLRFWVILRGDDPTITDRTFPAIGRCQWAVQDDGGTFTATIPMSPAIAAAVGATQATAGDPYVVGQPGLLIVEFHGTYVPFYTPTVDAVAFRFPTL